MKYLFAIIAMTLMGVANAQSWKLVWSDEFNEKSLDTTKWSYEIDGNGGGNNELQYYTNHEKNVRLSHGNLVIEAYKEDYMGKEYTSGRINTKHKVFWKCGKIEARMKLPYGQGIWPAFWMLGESIDSLKWPACGEIDIMELIGGSTGDNRFYSTLHWLAPNGHKYHGGPYTLPSGKFCDKFHVFGVEWSDKEMKFFCDSVETFKMDISSPEFDAFRKNFYILFNLAVGGNWPGNPNQTTLFPQKLLVDYVRVYQRNK